MWKAGGVREAWIRHPTVTTLPPQTQSAVLYFCSTKWCQLINCTALVQNDASYKSVTFHCRYKTVLVKIPLSLVSTVVRLCLSPSGRLVTEPGSPSTLTSPVLAEGFYSTGEQFMSDQQYHLQCVCILFHTTDIDFDFDSDLKRLEDFDTIKAPRWNIFKE